MCDGVEVSIDVKGIYYFISNILTEQLFSAAKISKSECVTTCCLSLSDVLNPPRCVCFLRLVAFFINLADPPLPVVV